MEPAGQLVVASDIRNTLFRRALSILDEVHAGLEDFNFGSLVDDSAARSTGELWGNSSLSQTGSAQAGALVPHKGGDPLEHVLATFVQGRTSTARRAVDAVAQIHNEIDSILCSFERDFPPIPTAAGDNGHIKHLSCNAVTGQPSEEVLRMAAATTAAAARFRVRAAEAAKSALQVYDNAAKQATVAAQATTQALEMQILAEQHSVAGNLPQALDSIRQANRLRDESAEAARLSRQFQKEYARHRREAHEAHLQADAAMRHAYSLEREALKSSSEAALHQYSMCKERYDRLTRQADELRAQAVYLDAEADAAVARAGQAQHQADAEMAGGNYDLGNALMQEAVRSQEQAGYARAQAKAARDSLQRLLPDLQAAREHMEEAERDVEDLSQRQARLQDATAKQRTDRLHEEADELAALCTAAEGAASMHEDLVRVYEERLAEDRHLYGKLSSEGRTAEADALAVHITTWEELLDVARKNLHTCRAEANAMRKRLTELSKADVSNDPGAAIIEGAEDFQQLREAKDKESLAAQAVAIMARGLSSTNLPDATVDGAGPATDGLLLQTEMHRQRIARLAEQMDKERQRLEDGHALPNGDRQSGNAQAEALLDSMAVSHLVGTLETTRLLQLWKQRSEQAATSAAEMRKAWEKLEQDATAKAGEAVRLEEQALALEQAGRSDEALSTMEQAGQLHKIAEQLGLEAEKAKSALLVRETAADNAQAQSRSLVQGLYDVEYAAGRLQSELGRRGYTIGDPNALKSPSGRSVLADANNRGTVTDAPMEAPSPVHEMAPAVISLPSVLSNVSNMITKTADLTGSLGMSGFHAYGEQPAIALDGDSVTARSGDATSVQMPSSRELGQLDAASLEGWPRGSAMGQTSITNSHNGAIYNQNVRFARLVQELESYAAIAAPDISVCRWEGHAGLILALQTDGNEDAILATSTELTALNDQLGSRAGLVEVQVQRDGQRTARWQELVAALQPGPDELVAAVAERTLARCVAAAVASKLTEDALALQANCHDALISGISSFRRVLANERTAVESVRLAQADASSLQRQAQEAQALDAELLQQVCALQDQLAASDSQGGTAQSLAVRFELQRLQNKHTEAAARANQLISSCVAAQEGVDEARRKEADVKGNAQSLSRMVMTLADAAKEAAVGMQHAVDGYRYAISALALGAKTDLTRLGSGGNHDIEISGADADVQTLVQRHADCVSQAQQSLEATRRLQQLADGGATPMLSPVFSRATTNTSMSASPTEDHGALASRRRDIGEQPALLRSILPVNASGSGGEPLAPLGSRIPLLRPSANGQSGLLGNDGRPGLPADDPPVMGSSSPLFRPFTGERPGLLGSAKVLQQPSSGEQPGHLRGINSQLPPTASDFTTLLNNSNPLLRPSIVERSGPLGSEISLLRPSAGEQLGSLGSRNQVLRPLEILQPGPHGRGNNLLRPSSGLISAMQPSSHALSSTSRRDLVVQRPSTGAEVIDGPDLSKLSGRPIDIVDGSVAVGIGSAFGASSAQYQVSVQRLSGVKLSGEVMPVSGIAEALGASSASSMSTSLPRISLQLCNARTGINDEAPGLSAFNPPTSIPGAFGALAGSKLQGSSLTPSGEAQTSKQSAADGPFGSLEVVLSGRSLMASHPSSAFKVTDAIRPISTEPQRGQGSQVLASLAEVSNSAWRPFLDAAPSGQLSMSKSDLPVKPPGIMLSFRAAKAAIHEESDDTPATSLAVNSQMGPGAGAQNAFGLLVGPSATIKPSAPSTLQVFVGSTPSGASNASAAPPDWQASDQVGHGVGQGRNLGRHELSTGMSVEPVAGVDRPSIRDVMAMEAELTTLHARHQQQLTELSSPRILIDGPAPGQDPSKMRRTLEIELQEAEDQLRAARAQQEVIRDSSPAELQASNDQLRCREQRVTMLQQALEACGDLVNDRISLEHVLAETNLVDLEAQQCDETLALLAKAADMCSKAARELHFQALDVGDQASPDIRQGLAYVQGKAADIEQRQQQIQRHAKRLGEKRHKVKEQWAAKQAGMKLREEWMQQARKAAAAAADTMAWGKRLASARAGLQRLEEPLHELQERAETTSDAAQKMTSAATQHRKQAEDLAQQAKRQREDARSFAANGKRLEADAANSMADSLQQQADGLTAQAARMEEDAGKLFSEANELASAAERARKRIVAQTEVVQQVSKAHQLSVNVLQWNCTAALKFYDAVQKHAAAAEQQLAVDQVERELIDMEVQNAESSGGGGARPDELASYMVHTVRAKQGASRMRAELQAAQQQVDQDRDAANAAIRQAAKAEGECLQLVPKIQELELQAQVSLHSTSIESTWPSCNGHMPYSRVICATEAVVGNSSTHGGGKKSSHSTMADFNLKATRSSQHTAASDSQFLRPSNPGPQTGDGMDLRSHVTPRTQLLRQFGDPSGGAPGDHESGLTAKVQLSGVTRTGTVGHEPQPQQVKVGPLRARTDGGKSGGGTPECIPSEARRNQPAKRAASPTASASKGEVGLPADNGYVTPNKWRIAVGAVNTARTFAVPTPPPASSPTGSAVGIAGAHVDWSPQDRTSIHASKARIALQEDDGQSERSYGHTTTPAAVGGTQARPNRFFQTTVHCDDSGPVTGLQRIGASSSLDRSPDRSDEVSGGTAGALLDKVANKSLKPLSHVKILNAAGKPVAQPYQNRDSTSSFESGTGGASAVGGVVRTGSVRSSMDSHADGYPKALAGNLDEELQMEDDGCEPESKMYRAMKQRVTDLEGRITELRRQGDTARTAAEILRQKQEQRRSDMSAAVDTEQTLQNALLEHGDAMIRLKQADSVLCHRRADFLEEELAVCRDGLQYAIIDWHYRREMKRLDERCTALTERAQSLTVEAQGFDAEVADASECIMLATSKAARGAKTYAATLEQQQIARFIEEQQGRLKTAGLRAAERRSEVAQIANIAKGGASRKLLVEKKALCNKALYQSVVELADAYDHAAKIVAKAQHVKLHGMEATADASAERVQQLEAEIAAQQEQNAKSSAAASKLRGSQPAAIRPAQQGEGVLGVITRLSLEVEENIQQCLQEITGEASEVLNVHRRRMEQICALVRSYQASYDCSDHTVDETVTGETATPQRLSEVSKRATRITAAQDAVHDLDRACGIASQLRALTLDAVEVHAAMFDLRADPAAIRVQLLGQKAATQDIDREEIDLRKQRLDLLEIEIPLARDQLTAALQVLEYRQAAAQLLEAQKELQNAATVAAEAVGNLESMITVRRENIAIMHRHINTIFQEARIFTANGNLLQAAAAEEAAQRLSKESLAAETSLAALIQESNLKRDEQVLATAAAEELQQVADSSLELVGILHRIISLQQEARAVSSRINELDGEQSRLERECASRQSLADHANKQAEQLQHESLQCRTNLKFSAADTYLNESRQCRISAQEHTDAAETAHGAADAAAQQQKKYYQRRKHLLCEVHLLHTAAGHLQGALSCMRDKHHLVRKLRDVEYQCRNRQQGMEPVRSCTSGPVREIDVLRTQVDASTATIKHHLASKTSYVTAADNLHLAAASFDRQTSCALQADAAMQDITQARVAAAITSGQGSVTLSVPLLTDGRSSGGGSAGGTVTVHAAGSELALIQPGKHEETGLPVLVGAPSDTELSNLQLQQAELRYRCLRGSLKVLEAIAAAAEQASEARCRQVDLSDQAAALVSDLAAKILEAEACANEAASLEAAVRANAALLDEDDEENVKVKLMLNALLQKAESYRNEALLLQGRIKELEEEERAAGAKAAGMEESLIRLQGDHRHALDALDLAERISQGCEQEAAAREQIQALVSEVVQLEREANGMENKIAQLRQQLTSASHTACSEDVANVMLVMQQIDSKLALHRQVLQQRNLELDSSREERERLSVGITLMKQRAEYVLHASETQEQVRQTVTRVAELQSDLFSAQTARSQCERMLDELRQQYAQLGALEGEDIPAPEAEGPTSPVKVRQSQQMAATQAAIALAEQMLDTHTQRVEVLQAAVAAWEISRQRQEALLRHQEQLMQQDSWRATLEQHRAELRKAAVGHAEKAHQLRATADKCSSGAALLLTADPDAAEHPNDSGPGGEALSAIRAQAATIMAASEAAERHARADAEDVLAVRAAALAQGIDREIRSFLTASSLVQPMLERLYLAASASVSVARLQLVCVGICSDQGSELSTMHEALTAVRGFAARIQALLEVADRRTRAGHNMEAAAARGQATAVQDALQQELSAVRLCKHRLMELALKMEGAKHELLLADRCMAQVTRSAAATQSVTEYAHRACELRYECGERQWGTLQVLRRAADASERVEVARRALKASQEAETQLTQAGKRDSATIVGRTVTVLKRSLMEAEAQRRLADAQAVQDANICGSEVAAAGLYMELAEMTVKLLWHVDEMEVHQEEHEQLLESLEAARRSQQASHTMLLHRRDEMQNLTQQIETHRCESQLLQKMGNEAQAIVRQEAANLLTSQLAEIAEDVMKLEGRCECLQQNQALLSSLHAKSESRMGLLSHLARLCSAAVGHLLDARDAHDNHSTHIREAAVAAVELSKEEEALSTAEARVQELRDSLEQLICEKTAVDREGGEHGNLQRGINLAQAELQLAHRRRGEAEQQVLAIRARVAQAELAEQSSQLRVTKARQRAEDAQKLADNVRLLLNGSSALAIDPSAMQCAVGTAADLSKASVHSVIINTQGNETSDPSHPHGALAAAQLHSVTLQALAEAASKFMQALDCAAMAEQRRSGALLSTQAAQAAREAAERQRAVVEELRAIAEGINMVRQVHQLTGRRGNGLGDDLLISNGGDRNADMRAKSVGGRPLLLHTASIEQDTAAIAELELERLQHESAYREADAAQEGKLAGCFLRQQELLRLASESLLEMARFGVAAELNAGPNMTADEASSLLVACKQLAEQHVTTLMLGPALDRCKHAEDYLKASLQCVQEAKKLRDKVISDRLSVLQDRKASYLKESDPVLRAVMTSSRSPRDFNCTAGYCRPLNAAMLPPGPAEEEAVKTETRLQEYNQLLMDEERMLMQVQELGKAASELLEEGSLQATAFTTRWADIIRQVKGTHQLGVPLVSDPCHHNVDSIVSKLPASPEPDMKAQSCHRIAGVPMGLLMLTALPSNSDDQSQGSTSHAISTVPDGFAGELSLRLMGPVTDLGEDGGQVRAVGIHASAQPTLRDRPRANTPKENSGGPMDRKFQKCGTGNREMDMELVAMAAATVARAKAAAAALAAKASSGLEEGHHIEERRNEAAACAASEPARNGPKATMRLHTETPSVSAGTSAHVGYHGALRQPRTHGSRGAAGTHGVQEPPGAAAAAAPDGEAPALGVNNHGCDPARPHLGDESSQDTLSSSLLLLPNGNTAKANLCDSFTSVDGAQDQDATDQKPVALQPTKLADTPAGFSTPRLPPAGHQYTTVPSPSHLAPTFQDQDFTPLHQLPRVPLPDDLDPATAVTMQSLWSMAALHYQRAQKMHECALQQVERQWQRCQAQVQMLQAEELKARTGGRLSDADGVMAARAKWQHRAVNLDTAMQCHRQELLRHKALVHRATIMVERLQLMAAAAITDGFTPAIAVTLDHNDVSQQLLPRFPGTMLTGCSILQPLERLHGELVQQAAALHATVAGLQQQSQRLFGKASRRSNKLKVKLGGIGNTAAHAIALAKSQSAADQSAALGERAVELAAHARMVQELADQLSGESANCLGILERLQHACDKELQAQQALVQAADLILCEATQAVLRGERGADLLEPMRRRKLDVAGQEVLAQLDAKSGNYDKLLQAQHQPGACLSAAEIQARRGEDMAQDAVRMVQSAREHLELQMGLFARRMDEAAVDLAAVASARSSQCDTLRAQADVAAMCVARARFKMAAQQTAHETAAAEKYSRAAEGWAKQAEKLKKEILVTSAAAEEIGSRGQVLSSLGQCLRPIQTALDKYLDKQLEAWAAAALSRI
ncbi:hypothetical protein VaNZ11_007215 [Volvox africanus]|uniref:Uncharacterized protein n=1 Tax=Volvox africanus TaxID=51714 RepID=A0ABQ5S2H4_9CHLO|nr:hypothetical protein VaNZ11_007215 [Volvox africanus]